MVFGKIDYLNLLPFHLFMKRFAKGSSAKMAMNFHKGVPAQINKKFISKRLDAAFISSIRARKHKNVNLAIISNKEVRSVLVVPHDNKKEDIESASSNVLANILNVHGEVLIGDKALKYYLSDKEHIDLAKEWYEKYKLPFVFALLCFHKDKHKYHAIEKHFLKQHVKIPQYILRKASQSTGIAPDEIIDYLKFITYKLDIKAKKGLKKFYHLSKHNL